MKTRYLLLIAALAVTPWIVNAVRLADCDFVANYRCEVVHGVGVVIPPLSYVTVWFDDDND